jgi:hypothetical protein
MTAPFRVRQAGARLAEPADDMNGRNGYMVLTGKGKATKERTDFERIRMRGYLREDMLHPSSAESAANPIAKAWVRSLRPPEGLAWLTRA